MSNAVKNIAKGGSYAFLGLLGGATLQYGYNIVLSRTYGANLTGIFAFGLSIANIGLVIGQLGIGETFLKYIAAYRGTNNNSKLKGLFYFAFPIVTVGVILVTLLLLLFYSDILEISGKQAYGEILIKFILLIIPLGFVQVISRIFQGMKRLDLMVLTREIGKSAIILICLGISLLASLDFDTFINLYLISAALLAVLTIFLFYRKVKHLRPVQYSLDIKGWRDYLLSVTIVDIFTAASSWIDILLLGFLLPAADVGIYFTSIRIALLATLGLTALNAIFSPIISELWESQNIKELDKTYKLTTRWSVILVFPTSLLIILLCNELMWMFGDDFERGSELLVIIIIGRLINGFTGGVGRILVMSKYQKIEMYNTFLTIGLLLFSILIFVPIYGLIGAVIINTVVIGVMNFLKLFQVWYFIGIQPYEFKYYKIIVAGIAAFVLGYFIKLNIISSLNNLIILIVTTLIFAIVYLITLVILKIEEEDMRVVNTVKAFIFNKFRK